ncbi:MAG: hypothetical protein B7Z44_03070 [Caulobacter sp. 12-67-6]|nr:MAG: hypothetical protein B7Z44_03070 [Caulobacter sp. 12-67-6]OYX71678.1 MAG: hypothetical protein B7Y81_08280 [Caulobacter sp. 32-67-35]
MVDMDAAGGAVTGGLIGSALEKPEGKAGEAHSGACTDCSQPVSGNFCAHCGQPTHVHRSLLHLGEELLHGVMHFDGRIWRTVPLLVLNPGRLTREWVEGKRSRYVSPLGLFLFTIFLMFFILSFGGGKAFETGAVNTRLDVARETVTDRHQEVAQAKTDLAVAERNVATAKPPQAEAAKAELDKAKSNFDDAVDDLADASNLVTRLEGVKAAGPRADGLEPGSWQADVHDAVANDRVKVNMGGDGINKKVLKKLSNPDLALYKIQQTLYKFSFLLVPLSIPFVALLFLWKRGFTLYDHGVFVLYSLTFMAMMSMALSFLGQISWLSSIVALIALIAPPVHMFAQLKGAYGLSTFSAAWRTLLLLIFCAIALALFLAAIILLGLGG